MSSIEQKVLGTIAIDIGERIDTVKKMREIVGKKTIDDFTGIIKFVDIDSFQPSISFINNDGKRYNFTMELSLDYKNTKGE